jgi:hypothetical protein
MQIEEQNWLSNRHTNQQAAQQYEAFDGSTIAELRVEAALHCATQAMAAVLTKHSCCIVALSDAEAGSLLQHLASQLFRAAQQEPDGQQPQQAQQSGQQGPTNQQQQQQTQSAAQGNQQQSAQGQMPPPAQPMLTVSSMRAVACHVAGASFWLPVPTVSCSCCRKSWELQAAAAGFFGNSPIMPGVWFSTQLLDTYTCLFGNGVSATAYAECLSKTASKASYSPSLPRTVTTLNNIDDRQVLLAPQRLSTTGRQVQTQHAACLFGKHIVADSCLLWNAVV